MILSPLTQKFTSVREVYRRLDDMLVSMRESGPVDATALEQESGKLKATLGQEVASLEAAGMADDAHQMGLRLLSYGLVCGALDGVLLYETGRLPAPLGPAPTGLEESWGKLAASLARACETAGRDWPARPADDLQLLAGYGKQQNLATGEETEATARQAGMTLPEYQKFLLATFKAGYAVGLVDAAVVYLAGQRPDAIA